MEEAPNSFVFSGRVVAEWNCNWTHELAPVSVGGQRICPRAGQRQYLDTVLGLEMQ